MERQHLILFLNRLLANYFVIYIKLHRYKWFLKGEHIFSLDRFYENLYITVKQDIDVLAEHILSMDGKPFATMVKFIKEATIEEATADDVEEEMIAQLQIDFSQINKEIVEIGIKKAEKTKDEITKQLLLAIQHKLNKYIWRCKAYYK